MRQLTRAAETTTGTGTGNLALAGALTGYQSLSGIGNGNRFPYIITEYPAAVNWEVGIGTYTTGPATLQRTTVLASSNGGAAVNWGAGTKVVMCGLPAELSLLHRHQARTTGFTAGAADVGSVFECTGTFTVSYAAAATLGSGWWCIVANKSGVQTHDPNASETIDSVTSFTTQAGENILVVCDGTELHAIGRRTAVPLPRRYRAGLTLSNNATDATNDIDVAVGECRNEVNTADIRIASALTKQLDATWVAGNNAGGRFATSIANGTWHVFAITNGSVNDVGFSQNLDPSSDPSYPAGYSYRRIGSILRESGAIVAFQQDDRIFQRRTQLLDYTAANIGTTAFLVALAVPTGLRLGVTVSGVYRNTSGVPDGLIVRISDPSVNDQVPSVTAAPLHEIGDGSVLDGRLGRQIRTFTNTSAQVRVRATLTSANYTLYLSTYMWEDIGL